MTGDAEPFTGSWAVCVSSLENCPFKSFACFLTRVFGFCGCWLVGVCSAFWMLTLYSAFDLQMFSLIQWGAFPCAGGFLCRAEFLKFDVSCLSVSVFVPGACGVRRSLSDSTEAAEDPGVSPSARELVSNQTLN